MIVGGVPPYLVKAADNRKVWTAKSSRALRKPSKRTVMRCLPSSIKTSTTLIKACKEGVPDDGKPFPEGSMIVKIEWIKKKPASPYFVEVPHTLKSLTFIEKDSKRLPKTHGWAFAPFDYDAGSKTFEPSVTGSECGNACHTTVKDAAYHWSSFSVRLSVYEIESAE